MHRARRPCISTPRTVSGSTGAGSRSARLLVMKSKSTPACKGTSRLSSWASRRSVKAPWWRSREAPDESRSRIAALPASHPCTHDHVGRLRRVCFAAYAATGGSEDSRPHRNRGRLLSGRIGGGGRESGHSESRAASLQNRGGAARKDVLDEHERSHVHQPQPGRQPSGHGEVLVQAASRHGGADRKSTRLNSSH